MKIKRFDVSFIAKSGSLFFIPTTLSIEPYRHYIVLISVTQSK
ncbi:hypothetical protein D920_02493 [Enterococcus faecalis 13-SD-W-01]|nr:hypothetical protein D920_02493 [Enterococcus faecalis 13-SD-W-01]